ncbi:hypothetical protein EYC84_005795 [Monilinia fructicola]|uniref:Uncharacterized protein n=1 Tax=Monilinia fructicola TaxID=38448 RepID=A0A5M9JXL3_MONFR|nr:hypothetical protein EYC84_005795 [Monilinia fructicola]
MVAKVIRLIRMKGWVDGYRSGVDSGVGRLFQRDMGTVINIWVVEERRKMVRRKKNEKWDLICWIENWNDWMDGWIDGWMTGLGYDMILNKRKIG